MNIRTLIVEDNKFAADFFRDMIEKQADFSLCAVLRDAEQAPEYCRVNRVDLVLMDVQTLHGHSGLSAAGKIKRAQPNIKIVVVTSLVDAEVLEKARAVCVDSLWYKEHGEQEIMDVILGTLEGRSFFPTEAPNVEIGSTWSNDLSNMQKDILRLCIYGDSYATIAKKLFIEECTVKYHMNQMIRKCGFSSKQQLIAAAIDSTIVAQLDDG